MTLSDFLDTVLMLSGLGTKSSYADSSDDEIQRLVSLANLSVSRLARHPWTSLISSHTFTLSTDTQYPLPDDFRAMIPDTMYEDSRVWGVDYPADPGQWSYLKSNSGGTYETKIRQIGSNLEVYQPESGTTVRFEYISKYPVLEGTTAKQYFSADTDTCKLDDDLLIADLLWRYKKMIGLDDWQADLGDFRELLQTAKGQDGGAKTVGDGEEYYDDPHYDLMRPVPNV